MDSLRPKVDRSYYNTPEFRKKLEEAAQEVASCKEYQEEIARWDICVGDGLSNRQKAKQARGRSFWCLKCDQCKVSAGSKCGKCGHINGKERQKH